MYVGYTLGIPDGPHNPSADQPLMQMNNDAINTLIGIDHIAFNANLGGYHNDIHFVTQAMDPVKIGGIGQLYTKTISSDVGLFFESGNGVVTQLTGGIAPNPVANGYTILPGGVIFQWGSITGSPIANGQVVTFPLPYPTAVFSITFGPQSNSTNDKTISITTGSVGLSGFTVSCSGTSLFQRLYWMALGN
jgi:hypothetical protein